MIDRIVNDDGTITETIFLDNDKNIVDNKNATVVIIKNWTSEGKMMSHESYFVEANN